MDYELLFFKSLALTIFIETSVLVIYLRLIAKLNDLKISRLLITGFIASFATLPYLWFILPNFVDQKIWYIIFGESFAILAETIIIASLLRLNVLRSFLCSMASNLISFFVGFIFNWPN